MSAIGSVHLSVFPIVACQGALPGNFSQRCTSATVTVVAYSTDALDLLRIALTPSLKIQLHAR